MFKKIYIEITNVCNYSCSFCKGNKRECGYISVENFERVIHKIKGYTKYIYLHVLGEPLLHKNLAEIVNIANQNDMNVSITTNASLIGKCYDELLSCNIRQINYSLHSLYESNQNVEDILDNIVKFIGASKNTYHSLRLWNIVNEKDINHELLNLLSNKLGITKELFTNLSVGKRVKIEDNIFVEIDKQFFWPDIDNAVVADTGKCYGLKSHIGILLDGTIVPCCLDCDGNIPLGNIYTDNLEDVLASNRAVNMRVGFQHHELREPLCKTCGFAMRLNKRM